MEIYFHMSDLVSQKKNPRFQEKGKSFMWRLCIVFCSATKRKHEELRCQQLCTPDPDSAGNPTKHVCIFSFLLRNHLARAAGHMAQMIMSSLITTVRKCCHRSLCAKSTVQKHLLLPLKFSTLKSWNLQ